MSTMDKDQEGAESATEALALSQTLLSSVKQWLDIPKFGLRVLGSEALNHLENSLIRTTSIIRTLKNATRPAVCLPPEILSSIFSLVPRILPFDMDVELHFPPSPHKFFHVDDLRPITAVCRHWRRVALGTPSLWSTMLDIAPGCAGRRALHVHYLSRCTGGPLYVALRRDLDQDTIEALSRHASRVREIYVYRCGPHFQDLISISLPNLEHCFLNDSPSVRPNTQQLFGSCDGLRTLLLSHASFLPTNYFPSLTRLRLNRLGPSTGGLKLPALFGLLSHTRGLVQLELRNLGPHEMDIGLDKQKHEKVQLDHLEHLTLSEVDYYDPQSYHGQRCMRFRRGLLEHLSIPDACTVSIGILGVSELRYIVDTTWRDRAATDMRLVIKGGPDTCTFTLEVANPSASQKAEFEVMQCCSTRPGPARDAVVEAVAAVLVADVIKHPILSAVRTLCIEFPRFSHWSPFSGRSAFLAGFPQLEVLRVSQDPNDDVPVGSILAALEVSSDGIGHVDAGCPLLAALTVDCTGPEEDVYVKDLARSRAQAGFAISRGVTIGSWVIVEPEGREEYVVRQYDSHGEQVFGP
ncbi:hypothetical protein LXA43DRAFT_516543 [Ganoderma leucocontextum]|nr:hypothetical protein LXA43DRAFT_516543 [Ganoderma leucocontextum]